MLIVNAQDVPNQTLQVQLGAQAAGLNIYQLQYGLFMDVYVGTTLIIAGVICENLNRIVRDSYLGFSGDLAWYDTQGESDPVYTGIGSRYQLVYLSPADMIALGLTG